MYRYKCVQVHLILSSSLLCISRYYFNSQHVFGRLRRRKENKKLSMLNTESNKSKRCIK